MVIKLLNDSILHLAGNYKVELVYNCDSCFSRICITFSSHDEFILYENEDNNLVHYIYDELVEAISEISDYFSLYDCICDYRDIYIEED